MKKVITYGTYDLLHIGHVNLLRRAKELGDYLIVGVTSDEYDRERGKLNVHDSLLERVEAVKATGYADEVIVEEYEGQKIHDILENDVDIFAIGSDWVGKFDYLKEYCNVVYLDRTQGVSSTELREAKHSRIALGIVGTGRIANRMVKEVKYVSGVEADAVFNPHLDHAQEFAQNHELAFATDDFAALLDRVDAVYIATPHQFHHTYTMQALEAGVHVLCEKPLALSAAEVQEEFALAREKGLTLLHGIKTAYAPAFTHMTVLAKSGRIGRIVDVEATFTKIEKQGVRELRNDGFGGSMFELGPYPLLPIAMLLGTNPESIDFHSVRNDDGVDVFTRANFGYGNASASMKVGLGSKSEGSMVITGTQGYIYVPAPWWKTEYFEMRFEDMSATRRYYYSFDGDGLRYELLEFMQMMHDGRTDTSKLTQDETEFIVGVLEQFKGTQSV